MFDSEFMIKAGTALWALGYATSRLVDGFRTLFRRGYTIGAAGVIIFGILVIAALLCAALLWMIGEALAASPGDSDAFLSAALGVAFPLGVCALTRVIIPAMPNRGEPRTAMRPLRLPLHLAYYFGAAAIAVLFIFRVAMRPAVESSVLLELLVALGLMAALILTGGRMRKQVATPRRLQAAVTDDPRLPVLYLREFEHEREPFVLSDSSAASGAMQFVLRPDLSGFETLEDFICEAVERDLGPLIALGGPQDYLQPLGAAREYVGDVEWKPRFESLARQAQAIVLHPGSSEQLGWEIACLLRAGLAHKLFVLVGPVTFASSFMDSVRWQMAGRTRQPKWPEFHRAMQVAGYELSLGVLPDSALIGFDGQGRGEVMPCQFSPDSYVQAMRNHLAPPARPQRFPYQ